VHLILQGVRQAFELLIKGDAATYDIALRSLEVAAAALAIALVVGVPLGGALALSRFPGRRFLVVLVNTGMGAPPVAVGLIVALFLWRTGPLGGLNIIYTVRAMIIAQVLIALPIVIGLTLAAMQQLDEGLRLQILALGAGRWRLFILLLREARVPLLAAVMAAFGAVISEVGAVMMVGGNIEGQTQVLTTAIMQDTSMGDFAAAGSRSDPSLAGVLYELRYDVDPATRPEGDLEWRKWPSR